MEGRDKRGDDGGGAAVCGEDSVSVCVCQRMRHLCFHPGSVFIHSLGRCSPSLGQAASRPGLSVCPSIHRDNCSCDDDPADAPGPVCLLFVSLSSGFTAPLPPPGRC